MDAHEPGRTTGRNRRAPGAQAIEMRVQLRNSRRISGPRVAWSLDMRVLIIMLSLLAVSGCSAMLLGADVAPAEQSDEEDDDKSRKER